MTNRSNNKPADRTGRLRPPYDSRTEAPSYSTAHKVRKEYQPTGAVSTNTNKRSDRPDDGEVSSKQYAEAARKRREAAGGENSNGSGKHIHLDYSHPLEDYLAKWWMQRLLGYVSRPRNGGGTIIEEVIRSYANPAAPRWQRIKYWPLHRFIRRVKGSVTDETFRRRIAEHRSTLRGFVATARSVAEFGLMLPQRFSAPLIAIWNFTSQCNLSCKHCYQDSDHQKGPDELTLEEKLDLIDQIGEAYVPMMSFAGGEPTVSQDLIPVLERCRHHGIHTSVATNGTTITSQYAGSISNPKHRRPSVSAAIMVVPEPRKGS